jgi:hypothetical protein
MKDYDAIARELNLRMPCEVEGHENDCPHPHVLCRECCERRKIARDAAILRKHDEAEASGELPDAEGEIDSYIDMGAFRDPKVARPYLIDGYRLGYGAGKQYARSQMRPAPTDEKALCEAIRKLPRYAFDMQLGDIFKVGHGAFLKVADIEALLAREAPKDKHPVTYPKKHVTDGSRKGLVMHAPRDESKEGDHGSTD